MPTPFDPRKKPVAVKIHISTGEGVDIAWSDGHSSHFDFAYLRAECPCAMCNDERMKKAEAPAMASTGAVAGLGPSLPMFKPKVTARKAHSVGNYAIQIDFSDGHSTGIYSFDLLRMLCPCDECARSFRAGT